jgi:hypothetical protein
VLDKLTYKQKNYGLLLFFVLLVMVSYKRSFVFTLNAMAELENQEAQKASTLHVESDIETLQIQIAQLNKNIGKSDIAPDLVNQEILGEISDFSLSNSVNLQALEETHSFQTVDYTIYSNLISVEGTFNGILSLVYHMENKFEYARLTNIDIYKEKDFSNKKVKLYGKLLFQHYRQN